jgi:tetratricopeptide (TPR) repeat protein
MSGGLRGTGPDFGPAGHPPAPGRGPVAWPVRSGRMPPRAAGFTTRLESAGDLRAELSAGTAVALIPAPDTAGGARRWPCGKTQLAAQAVESLFRSRTVDLLAWVTADSRMSVLSGYSEAAASLGLADGGSAEDTADRLVRWLRAARRPWLLVLDDVRDSADLDGLWPSGPSGRVLVTAPDPAAVPARGVLMREVPAFSAREAMSYLAGKLTTDPDHRAGALDLVTELGCEPAALAHAAAVIADADLTCRDYRRIFVQRREQFALVGGEIPAAAVTWTLSVEHAGLIAPGGGTWPMLVLVSLLDGHGIPATVLTAPAVCRYLAAESRVPAGPQHAWILALALHRAGLADVDVGSDPPLMLVSAMQQAAVRAAAQPGLLERAIRAGADALAEAWPGEWHRSVLSERFLACAASLKMAAGDALWTAEGCHMLLWLAGQGLDAAGMAAPAVGWWRQLTADSTRIFGQGHPDTLAAAGQLAAALLVSGQAAEAVSWSEWVLDGRSGVFGPDHPATVAAQADLGRALAAVGKPGDAATVLDGALLASERVHGADERVTLAVREDYASACLAAGRTKEAIRVYQQVLEAHQRVDGQGHPLALAAGVQLGKAYLDAGQPGEAITVYERMLGVSGRVLGPDHPGTLGVGAAVASAYASAGRIGEALRTHEDVGAASERVLGATHPDTLTRRADLARAYWAAGQAQDALAVLADTIDRSEKALPPGDPRIRALRQALTEMTGG